MSAGMITRTTTLTLTRDGSIFGDGFEVSIDDEGGGEYISVKQIEQGGELTINPDEWSDLKEAVDSMAAWIAKHERQPTEGAPND